MAENVEGVTEGDLMREFMRISLMEIREGELTVTMFSEFMNIKRKKAEYLLDKYTTMGLLKVRKIIFNGKNINAYSPDKGTWKDVVDTVKKL